MTNGANTANDLRAVLLRRIERLELQQAEFGINVPPHILEDLEQARESLKKIDTIPPSHHERIIMVAVLDLTSQMAALKREFREDRKLDAEDRDKRRQETDQYRLFVETHIRRLWMSVAANATATVIAWLFGRRTLALAGRAPLPPLWKWLFQAYVFIGAALVWRLRTRYGLWHDP